MILQFLLHFCLVFVFRNPFVRKIYSNYITRTAQKKCTFFETTKLNFFELAQICSFWKNTQFSTE